MLKQGTIKLNDNFFPKLNDTWTKEEKDRMLIITCIDDGNGLSLFQSVPGLAEKSICISYKEQYRAMINLLYPHITNAIEKEFVHTKLICLLNNASGEEKKTEPYKITFIFICDEEGMNFKLASIFTGDTDQGTWATNEQVEGFASCLQMPVYKSIK